MSDQKEFLHSHKSELYEYYWLLLLFQLPFRATIDSFSYWCYCFLFWGNSLLIMLVYCIFHVRFNKNLLLLILYLDFLQPPPPPQQQQQYAFIKRGAWNVPTSFGTKLDKKVKNIIHDFLCLNMKDSRWVERGRAGGSLD